jgi:uncharacterized FlaG/YvyC family protein
MHYFESNGVAFNYNSDCSGELYIRNKITNEMIEIPTESILDFVGMIKMNEMISEIGQKSYRDILGL